MFSAQSRCTSSTFYIYHNVHLDFFATISYNFRTDVVLVYQNILWEEDTTWLNRNKNQPFTGVDS